MRRGWAEGATGRAAGGAIALAAAIGGIAPPAAAVAPIQVLASATAERTGPAVEIHLGFKSAAPRWKLSTQGSELWIDFDRIRIEVPPRPLFGAETGPVAAVRVIDLGGDRGRVTIEVSGKADYAIARLKREIVLRVAPAGAVPDLATPLLTHRGEASRASTPAKRVAASPGVSELPSATPAHPRAPTEPSATTEEVKAPAPLVSDSPLVMIDPGHGGYDPGTVSQRGLSEKDLALRIALRLERALRARGVRTAMTRTADVFLPLADRTRLANRAGADLFVSIHLNSSPNLETTGIEVYYLNNTTDRATIRLARMENGGAPGYGAGDGANLNYILTDLRQQYKAAESASLARMIDAQAAAELDAGLGLNVNALGARRGPFYVLVGARMPAVLIECGFLSNRWEAARLDSAQYQELLARGIADAVVHYFNADAAVGNL